MEMLMVLTYTAICVAIFKIFKVPLTKWTVPTAVLGGILLIGSMLLLMNYNHPYSEVARKYVPTTPVVPEVSGHVIEVPVKPNQPLQPGDILFRIDPTPFEAKVTTLEAQLKSAIADEKRARALLKKNVGSQRDVDLTEAKVDALKGELELARFQLDKTVVRAATEGYVSQVILHPGMRATQLPMRPSMVFVHEPDATIVAFFWQNNAHRIKPGLAADVAFDAVPGKVFSAEVVQVLPMLAEGQLQPSGNLMTINPYREMPGRVPVELKITDPRFAEYAAGVPGGAFGQAAVYSEHVHHVAVMRKILLRMASWMNFVFPFH